MRDIIKEIAAATAEAVKEKFGIGIPVEDVLVTPTKKEHQGDYTIVTFPLAKPLRQSPMKIAEEIRDHILRNFPAVHEAEIIQGFINLSLSSGYWLSVMEAMKEEASFWKPTLPQETVLVEFSSPNTNKPLHLGHIRNILLGWSMYKILKTCGQTVYRVQIINDRGIAICKSMLAWDKFTQVPPFDGDRITVSKTVMIQ